ncbi:hypothetical protein [Ancylobacter terrae]|uniref:hypothetical protein n=1 Tax=Ancylobacter sp. sgz301288 TaxID=3342077 RepID=UPI00385F7109
MGEQFLDIAEVKAWADTILAAMERAGIASVPLDQQYYHAFVGVDAAFDMAKAADMGVGDLQRDLDGLRKQLAGQRSGEDLDLSQALERLQAIIGYLAHASGGTVASRDDGEEG